MVGTSIDQGMTSIYDYDFSLQAHAGMQGIARAVHYTILHKDKKLSPNTLQQGINEISYLWSASMKGVSLKLPAYWQVKHVQGDVTGRGQ
ncbi:hypothetical protein ACEPAF_8547 [Sanghuangporus sanghuang]